LQHGANLSAEEQLKGQKALADWNKKVMVKVLFVENAPIVECFKSVMKIYRIM
jgi:hypothetical protein